MIFYYFHKKKQLKMYLKKKIFHLEVLIILIRNEKTLGELFTFLFLETILLRKGY